MVFTSLLPKKMSERPSIRMARIGSNDSMPGYKDQVDVIVEGAASTGVLRVDTSEIASADLHEVLNKGEQAENMSKAPNIRNLKGTLSGMQVSEMRQDSIKSGKNARPSNMSLMKGFATPNEFEQVKEDDSLSNHEEAEDEQDPIVL